VRVGPVDFEWDDAKAEANLRKHRFSFTDALAIFADPTRITIDTIRADDGEERRKTIGSVEGSLFTAVFVMRGTTCRLISARRAKVQGERAYGRAKLDHANPPMLSDETRAAIGALTPEDIERNAETDPDNPPFTHDELDRVRMARVVQGVRRARRMTHTVFAETHGIAVARLRDWEQGRLRPDAMAMAYLATIVHESEAVHRALEKARAA